MSLERKVPELSLVSYIHGNSDQKAKFVNDLLRGLKEYGFITLVEHTVQPQVIDRAYSAVKEFFKLPVEVKSRYICAEGAGQRGYTSFGAEHAKDNDVPDLKEFWHVGREISSDHKFKKYYPDNLWVSQVPDFKESLSQLYSSLDHCAVHILHALGKGLDLPENFFADMIKDGNSILRPIHYPPVPEDAPKKAIRAAAHEDINLITMLIGATDSGLQLLDRDGTWLDVVTRPGEIVVDSGDMLSRITNDVIPATTHRVVNPADTSTTRFSMPFFVHPHPEAELRCISSCLGSGEKYPPINSHEFLLQRLHEIGLMK